MRCIRLIFNCLFIISLLGVEVNAIAEETQASTAPATCTNNNTEKHQKAPFGMQWLTPICALKELQHNNQKILSQIISQTGDYVLVKSKYLPLTPNGVDDFKLLYHKTLGLIQITMKSIPIEDNLSASQGLSVFDMYTTSLSNKYGPSVEFKKSNFRKLNGGYAYQCIKYQKCRFYAIFVDAQKTSITLELKALNDSSGYIEIQYNPEISISEQQDIKEELFEKQNEQYNSLYDSL